MRLTNHTYAEPLLFYISDWVCSTQFPLYYMTLSVKAQSLLHSVFTLEFTNLNTIYIYFFLIKL